MLGNIHTIFIHFSVLTSLYCSYHLTIQFGTMAARKTFTNTKTIVATPKKTSIGDGRRKRGSFKVKGQKPYRGQGK